MGLEAYLWEPSTHRTFWLGKGSGVFAGDYLSGTDGKYRAPVDPTRAGDVIALEKALRADWEERLKYGTAVGDFDPSIALEIAAFVASSEGVEVRNDHQSYDDEGEDDRIIVASRSLDEVLAPDPKADLVALHRARLTR